MGNAVEKIPDDDAVAGLPVGYSGGDQSLAVSLARAEIDQQIATARALPRSVKRAIDNILTLATLDEESAEECVYALPRGGKPIKGPSVRLAEIIASQWGNCRVAARVVHVDRIEKYVEAEGIFHDLETNTATTARVRRRIVDSKGRIYNDDMIIVTGNAACAIAKRNAILGAVPKGVWRRAYVAVESVLAGDVKTLVERREKAMKAFAAFGAKPEQVFAALGVAGLDEIGTDHLTTLMGMHSALKTGEASVEEMFPTPKPAGDKPKLAETLDRLAATPADTADPETGEIVEKLPPADDTPKTAPATGKPREAVNQPADGVERTTTLRGATAAQMQADRIVDDNGKVTKDRDAAPPPADDDFPGDRPTPAAAGGVGSSFAAEVEAAADGDAQREQTPADVAFDKGFAACKAGRSKRAIPGEYRGDETLSNAWLDGYEAAEKEKGGAS